MSSMATTGVKDKITLGAYIVEVNEALETMEEKINASAAECLNQINSYGHKDYSEVAPLERRKKMNKLHWKLSGLKTRLTRLQRLKITRLSVDEPVVLGLAEPFSFDDRFDDRFDGFVSDTNSNNSLRGFDTSDDETRKRRRKKKKANTNDGFKRAGKTSLAKLKI